MDMGVKLVAGIALALKKLSDMFPPAAPIVAQFNDLMPQLQQAIMSSGAPGEAAAPPVNG